MSTMSNAYDAGATCCVSDGPKTSTKMPSLIASPTAETPGINSFECFMESVRSSVEVHAQRKGYTRNGVDGQNDLAEVDKLMGTTVGHCVGEIVYKLKEYMTTPRRVVLEKVAGWAFILWRSTDE